MEPLQSYATKLIQLGLYCPRPALSLAECQELRSQLVNRISTSEPLRHLALILSEAQENSCDVEALYGVRYVEGLQITLNQPTLIV